MNTSVSDLDFLVNKKKINKKSEEISVEHVIKNVSEKSSTRSKTKQKSVPASSSTSTNSTDKNRKNKRDINKENNNIKIKQEKEELLYRLYVLVDNSNGRFSSKCNINDNSLEDIKNEIRRIKNIINSGKSSEMFRAALVLGIKGIEMSNNYFDPTGGYVDLDGWGDNMTYELSQDKYNEVILELCEKYGSGPSQFGPEVRLLFALTTSAIMFSITKKMTSDPAKMMSSFLGNIMQPQQRPQPQQQNYQQQRSQQPQQQQQNYQQQRPQQSQQQQQNYQQRSQQYQDQEYAPSRESPEYKEYQKQHQQQHIPSPIDLANIGRNMYAPVNISEDSDNVPSKIRGPNMDIEPDIQDIIKKMNKKKEENQNKDSSLVFESEDKKIDLSKPKKKGGRPKKVVK